MTKKIDLTKFSDYTIESIPSWALPYISYGDSEGISEEGIAQIEKWRAKMLKWGFCPDFFEFVREGKNGDVYPDPEQESYFDSFPAFGLPCECYSCLFVTW